MRVTALLGAGASVDLGGPLSTQLTNIVRRKKQNILDKNHNFIDIPFIEEVAKELDQYFEKETANFEDIFATLEGLYSYCTAWQARTVKKFKPHLGAFLKIDKQAFFDGLLIYTAKRDLIQEVGDCINNYDTMFEPESKHSWFSSFWRKADQIIKWDVATLNYDNCIEKSIINYQDGFESLDSNTVYKRFNPSIFNTSSNESKIYHLHGNILYGYPRDTSNLFVFEDQHEDLFLFSNYEDSCSTWFNRSNYVTQSHEQITMGPIITGLRKTDKLLTYPYSSYYSEFQNSLFKNNKLIIIGYSFSDAHINSILDRMVRFHGDSRRIVVVDYFPYAPQAWIPEPGVMGWPTQGMNSFFIRSSKDHYYLKNHSYQERIISSDECFRVYLGGVKKTFEEYGDEIIEFLSS